MAMKQLLSLEEYLAYKAECRYIGDLHDLDVARKRRAAHALERVEPEMYSLSEWNSALAYIVNEGPANSPEEARTMLEKALTVLR